jgi:hypothetical protein
MILNILHKATHLNTKLLLKKYPQYLPRLKDTFMSSNKLLFILEQDL